MPSIQPSPIHTKATRRGESVVELPSYS